MSRSGPAFDRRRFNAPDSVIPVRYEDEDHEKKGKGKAKAGREDGRGDGDVRPIFMKLGLVTQANGSCYLETGRMKLICAVYGPKPVPRSAPYSSSATLSVSLKFTPFALPGNRTLTPGPPCESPSLSSAIHRALLPSLRLDLLPRSTIEVFVTIIEWDAPDPTESLGGGDGGGGGDGAFVGVANAVTACSAALASAGVEMYGLVIGAGTALFPPSIAGAVSPGRILLDPTFEEASVPAVVNEDDEVSPEAFVSVAVMPALGTTTCLTVQASNLRKKAGGWIWGGFSVDGVENAAKRCSETATLIHGVVVRALQEFEEGKGKADGMVLG